MIRKKMKKSKVALIALTVLVLAMGTFALTGCGGGSEETAVQEPEPIINPITGEEMDSELPARPVMVSIPNDNYGAVPQSNISQADIIYEVPVEGQMTRLQAVFYSQFPDKVGPIRSVRYYFVDLAREYKAAHVGYGWGKRAKGYMEDAGVPHINGMQDTDLFYRAEDKTAPNDAYINWDDIQARADEEGWFDTVQTIKPFKFRDADWEQAKKDAQALIDEKGDSKDEQDQKDVEKAKALVAQPKLASSVSVTALGCNSKCEYNKETGLYDRYWYGEKYIDKETDEQLSFANVLVQYVDSVPMTDETTGALDDKGRLEIDLNSGGQAMLFTNGEVIKGTWSKKDPDSRTIFKDENGNQFRFSQGKTWVYVVDENMDCTYEEAAAEDTTDTSAESEAE